MNTPLYDITVEAFRVLFIVGGPLIIVAGLSGTLISFLQTVTSLPDPALSYGVRVLAVVATLYLLLPSAVQSMVLLMRQALE